MSREIFTYLLDSWRPTAPDVRRSSRGERAMRCLACGADMHVVHVEPDDTTRIPGYANHIFACSGCPEKETRLLFRREPVAPPPRPAAVSANESIAPAVTANVSASASTVASADEGLAHAVKGGGAAVSGMWERAVAKVRNQQIALQEKKAALAKSSDCRQQFNRSWDDLIPQQLQALPQPQKANAMLSPSGTAGGTWTRAIAMLRGTEDRES
jgi:hypothetical protein